MLEVLVRSPGVFLLQALRFCEGGRPTAGLMPCKQIPGRLGSLKDRTVCRRGWRIWVGGRAGAESWLPKHIAELVIAEMSEDVVEGHVVVCTSAEV